MSLRQWLTGRSTWELLAFPVVALSTVGGAWSVLGEDWLQLLAFVASGAALVALLMYLNLADRVKKLDRRLELLSGLIAQGTWKSGYAGTCSCLPESSSTDDVDNSVVKKVRELRGHQEMEEALIDMTALVSPNRRVAIYYGNAKRLEPFRRSGWLGGEPPAIVCQRHDGGNDLLAPHLLSALGAGSWLYIRDVTAPGPDEAEVAGQVPGRQEFRSFACFPMHVRGVTDSPEQNGGTLVGCLLLQQRAADALPEKAARELLAMMCSLTAATFVHGLVNHD